VHGVWLQGSAYSIFALLRPPCACPMAENEEEQEEAEEEAFASPRQRAAVATSPTAQGEHRGQEERWPGQEAASPRGCEHSPVRDAGCGAASSRLFFSADTPPPAASRGEYGAMGAQGACRRCWGRGGEYSEAALPPACGGSWNYGLEWEVLVSALRHLTLDLHSSVPLTAGVR